MARDINVGIQMCNTPTPLPWSQVKENFNYCSSISTIQHFAEEVHKATIKNHCQSSNKIQQTLYFNTLDVNRFSPTVLFSVVICNGCCLPNDNISSSFQINLSKIIFSCVNVGLLRMNVHVPGKFEMSWKKAFYLGGEPFIVGGTSREFLVFTQAGNFTLFISYLQVRSQTKNNI